MSETTKIWDTWDSTPLSNVAYKRSWRKKRGPTTPDLDQDALEAENGERRSCRGCQ